MKVWNSVFFGDRDFFTTTQLTNRCWRSWGLSLTNTNYTVGFGGVVIWCWHDFTMCIHSASCVFEIYMTVWKYEYVSEYLYIKCVEMFIGPSVWRLRGCRMKNLYMDLISTKHGIDKPILSTFHIFWSLIIAVRNFIMKKRGPGRSKHNGPWVPVMWYSKPKMNDSLIKWVLNF